MTQDMQPPEANQREDSAGNPDTEAPLFSSLSSSESKEPSCDEQCGGLCRTFFGSHGLRAGWSIVIFIALTVFFLGTFNWIILKIDRNLLNVRHSGGIMPLSVTFVSELMSVLAILLAGIILALIERRRLRDYYLSGPRRFIHFVSGLGAGFVALSVLVGVLALGGWAHFARGAISGRQIFVYAVCWGAVFLLTGFFEEGSFRCYLQYTFTRGINFWWALAIVTLICLCVLLLISGHGLWGVYLIALLGLFPCLYLHVKKTPNSAFWQAAWVTSTLFGSLHTSNSGENWIGIFTAAFVGFIFCASVWLTGSAWWAIGCHASWDWAETYFYGTANSGMVTKGHLLTTSAVGNVLWSGGSDGPEGSLLVIPTLLLLLLAIIWIYGRRKEEHLFAPGADNAAP